MITKYVSLEFLGFPDYKVGTDGSVWSKRKRGGRKNHPNTTPIRWRQLRSGNRKDEYQSVLLCSSKGHKEFQVHRLVLLAFVGPCPEGMQGCHFPDRDRSNNQLVNLSWDTCTENQRDRKYHGTDSSGEANGQSKLTELKVKKIRRLHNKLGLSYGELGRRFQVSSTLIRFIVLRMAWKHVN